MQISDRISGGGLAALGLVAFIYGSKLPPVRGQPVGPEVFPMVVGAGLMIFGVLIALGIGRSFEGANEVVAAEDGTTVEEKSAPFDPLTAFKVALPPALLLFYVFFSERIGFIPTAFVIVSSMCLALGARWKAALLMGLFAPPVIHLIFAKMLRVPLPAGLLPMPW